ncbi:MAG: hypothetical protein RI885_1881 [Actinomycetota bacterium]
MSGMLQRRGLSGSGVSEILSEARAPKGVLYHHFPGGKNQLAIAAIEASVGILLESLERRLGRFDDPLDALDDWIAASARRLSTTDFDLGCPLAAVSLESAPSDVDVRQSLASAFDTLRTRIAAALTAGGPTEGGPTAGGPAAEGPSSGGWSAEDAEGTAALIVAAYEGGLMQSRVAGSARPMAAATTTLSLLLRERRMSRRNHA